MSEEERFWSKVDKSGDCWLWKGTLQPNGYGCFWYKDSASAHRADYILTKGEIPAGTVIMHSCDNRQCVYPEHLSVGSWSDNTRDAMEKKRHSMPPGSGKLTIEQVREIRDAYAGGGLSYRWLAAHYHVDYKTIYEIIKQIIWREP